MKNSPLRSPAAPSTRTGVLFSLVAAFCAAQVGWWIILHHRDSGERGDLYLARAESQVRALEAHLQAARLAGLATFDATAFAQSLPPETALVPVTDAAREALPWFPARQLDVAPAYRAFVAEKTRARVIMFAAEGSFFLAVMAFGLYLVYRSLRGELALNRRQANFVASVTHELKSPLASIRLFAETLLRDPGGADPALTEKAARRIVADSARLQRLVENLLEAARYDQGAVAPERKRVNLAALVRGSAAEVIDAAAAQDVRIEVAAPDAAWVWGDEGALARAIGNLVDNAVKYSSPGGAVRMNLRAAGNEAVLEVADEGAGLDSNELAQVFARFYRAGDDNVRARPGTGLGLYLAQQIAQYHGGTLSAASAGKGKGACFTLRLPLAEAHVPPPSS